MNTVAHRVFAVSYHRLVAFRGHSPDQDRDSAMIGMLEMLFWTSAAVIVYVYAGYPACLWLLSRRKVDPSGRTPEHLPTATLIISAFNEERCIASKLDNSLALD